LNSDNPNSPALYEVEQKFVVSDLEQLEKRLAESGFSLVATLQQRDIYLRHPVRDFRQTDEALRIRVSGGDACVTYKGRRLPGPVKTRPEIELHISPAEVGQWVQMVDHLGFKVAAEVHKTRREFRATSKRDYEQSVALDHAEGLGDFAEIEIVVERQEEIELASERVMALATELGLRVVQPKSYLGMLLEKIAGEPPEEHV